MAAETGSLALGDLPGDLLTVALRFVDHRTLLRLERVNLQLRSVITQFGLWQSLARSQIEFTDSCQSHRSSAEWKRLTLLAVRAVHDSRSHLREVRECSSVDHENESAENTLRWSHCGVEVNFLGNSITGGHPLAFLQLAARVQVECGCARGRPCYWSTASTWSPKTDDYIEYTVSSNCLVDSVQIVPYRVFWYPGSPTYSPKRISFALYETRDDGTLADVPVHQSKEYSVVKDMKLQTFWLPRRVFLSRGVLRLNLMGRQEDIGVDVRQWMEENNLPPYYICLSYVGATGILETPVDESDNV